MQGQAQVSLLSKHTAASEGQEDRSARRHAWVKFEEAVTASYGSRVAPENGQPLIVPWGGNT